MENTKEFTHLDPSTFKEAFENTLQHRVTQRVMKFIKEDPSLEPLWVLKNGVFTVNQFVIEGPTEVQFSLSYNLLENKMTVWIDEDEGEYTETWTECKTQEEFVDEIANYIFGMISIYGRI